jgi:hypothetical protein
MSPSDRVGQLYPKALGPLSVAFSDSQGYGGGILTRLHGRITSTTCSVSFALAQRRIRTKINSSLLSNFSFALSVTLTEVVIFVLRMDKVFAVRRKDFI